MLIHGMLNPWQIWETAIEALSGDYYVIVPELNAHTEEEPTKFRSVESEAAEIMDFLLGFFFSTLASFLTFRLHLITGKIKHFLNRAAYIYVIVVYGLFHDELCSAGGAESGIFILFDLDGVAAGGAFGGN